MKVYVLRHGRTDCNDKMFMNGVLDEDINETGVQQAREAADKIKDFPIDMIICSPMKRAMHTAQIVNIHNVPVIYCDALTERDVGSITGKPMPEENAVNYWNYYAPQYEDIETVPQLFGRVHTAMNEIMAKYGDKNLLIVTHNGVCRAIHAYFNPIPRDGLIGSFGSVRNCGINEYNIP